MDRAQVRTAPAVSAAQRGSGAESRGVDALASTQKLNILRSEDSTVQLFHPIGGYSCWY